MTTRLIAPIAALLLALTIAAPAAAAEPPDNHPFIHGAPGWFDDGIDQYHYSRSWGGWVDDRCGTSQEHFRVVVYNHANYEGPKTRICHSATNRKGTPNNDTWCEIPLGWNASWGSVDACRKANSSYGVANDRVTSMKIWGLDAGECVRFFEHKNHKGRWFTRFSGSVPNLGNYKYPNTSWHFNDRLSSTIRKASSGPCSTAYGQN